MKALFLKNYINEEFIDIVGDDYHHLVNVLRVKKSENILVLNNSGNKYLSEIFEIDKKKIKLNIKNRIPEKRTNYISLAIGLTKKEALEEIIKASIELGVVELLLLESEYSQKYELSTDRIERLIKSAIEQSNNPFGIQVRFIKIGELDTSSYDISYLLSLKESSKTIIPESHQQVLLVIGPEGGFSQFEEKEFINRGLNPITIKSHILRSKTAIVAGVGLLHGLIMGKS